MRNVRQPLEILKETAMILCAQDQLDRNAMELATSPTYLNVQPGAVLKIIRVRLAVHNVGEAAIYAFEMSYLAAREAAKQQAEAGAALK